MSVQTPSEDSEGFADIGYKLSPKNFYDAQYWPLLTPADPDRDLLRTLLQEDRVEAARDHCKKTDLGKRGSKLGFHNLIVAEAETRAKGQRLAITSELAIEFLPQEQGGHIKELSQIAQGVVEKESKRFGWPNLAKTLICLLPKEFDAPWATSRFGYCAPRDPYYKIGIPFHASAPQQFTRVMTHEFAHVISESESKQRIPHWVSEGFSVFASDDFDAKTRDAFLQSPKLWLDPLDLGAAFAPAVDLGSREKWLVYQQAGWIVRFMAGLSGEKELVRFLAEFADESFWKNMEMDILGQSRIAEALHRIYGCKDRDLFAAAYEDLPKTKLLTHLTS